MPFGEQVEHGGVPGEHHAVDSVRRKTGLLAQAGEQPGKAAANGGRQLGGLAVHGLLQAGDHVRAEHRLGVFLRPGGQQRAVRKAVKIGRHRGGADVHRRAPIPGPRGPGRRRAGSPR